MDPFSETLTEKFSRIIEEGSENVISDIEIIMYEVNEWEKSPLREMMLDGQRYYENQHDILERKKMAVGEDGILQEVKNIANNKIVHGFIRKMVDQKVGYLLSLPFTVQTKNESYLELLTEYFTKKFYRMFQNVGKEAINKGKAWIHIYYDEQGSFSLKRIPSEEIIPFWKDSERTELDYVIRSYRVKQWTGKKKDTIHKVEVWDTTGVYRYVVNKGKLIPDVEIGEYSPHLTKENGDEAEGLNWLRIPFVCFKYNEEEQPIINFVKSIVDDYDRQKSDNSNNLEELPNGGIYVVKNYDGTDLGEFRRNLTIYRAVKVDEEGGLDSLNLQIDTEAFKTHMDMQRKDLYELGRGVDTQSDRFGNDRSGIALRFLYADLDMDANNIETEFQAALEQLKWFIDQDIAVKTGQDFSNEEVEFIFNRDIIINESEVIDNANKSAGQISDETIIANHPWVKDLQTELGRLKKQYGANSDYQGAFGNGVKGNE
ncbi:phage portal protein [Lysinibacillus sp. NPDC096212]|uniref:phage portal protein n=1 Tax=Lysinibacillus sp. NPDC096212 TaxID=3364135 RepID=UPI003817EFFF